MDSTKEIARAIYEMNQLRVSQKDGAVRTGKGEIIGRQKWIVNADYGLDTKVGEDFIVNAASREEAEDKVGKLIDGIAKRKGLVTGIIHVNHSDPMAKL